jgi:hypothetical protein
MIFVSCHFHPFYHYICSLAFYTLAGFTTSKFDTFDDELMGYEIDEDVNSNLSDAEDTTSIENLPQRQRPPSEPDFDYMSFRNVTILVDSTAYLKCFVKNIGNKTVSWVRHRGINLLTVGTTSYTSDSRFQSIHDSDSDEWILKVRNFILIKTVNL